MRDGLAGDPALVAAHDDVVLQAELLGAGADKLNGAALLQVQLLVAQRVDRRRLQR